jgi:cytidyltransferase-like protein|tara:strand:- start:2156 stop:2941 length:786 start_codon:yes stop_codon:yes gene_type:complete
MKRIVLVTGGFDPLHSGHIAYFKAAKELGNELWVGVNSDEWLTNKKGRPFMPLEERIAIIKELAVVDHVIDFDDDEHGSACGAIFKTLATCETMHDRIIFANGGDRTNTNSPEMNTYSDHSRVEFAFGVGGEDKKNSSSWILDNWKTEKTFRNWGWYRVLDNQPNNNFKIKELVIEPGKSLSDQRHFKRSEHWYVLKGNVQMDTEFNNLSNNVLLTPLTRGYDITVGTWHKASNPSTTEHAHILEVQYGEACVEEDIERRD